MIAAWMLYCSVLGALIACAASLGERIAFDVGAATRRVWATALTAAAVLPIAAVLLRDGPPARELNGVLVAASPVVGVVMESVDVFSGLDGVLLFAWVAVSVTLAVLLLVGLLGTWWRRRRWVVAEVDGVSVLVSDDVGPAVVGLLRSRIVLPHWAIAGDGAARTMILRHEMEHVAAGDPRLVLFGALMVVAMPWNPAVWYMVGRGRLAIEVDCDRRVMTGGDLELRRYAELLIEVGRRRTLPAYGVGFSVGRPFLERRIDRMTAPVRRDGRLRGALLVCGVTAALGAAWTLPQPVRAADVSHEALVCPGEDYAALNTRLLNAREWST